MRIESFSVTNQRSVVLAACQSVPSLMILAGPNGAGKSTLLNALRQSPGSGPIIYIPPHRTARRQNVMARHLHQQLISMEELMAGQGIPGYEGINLITGSRDPWSFDDTVNYLKHGLCQIEIERQHAITERLDRTGSVTLDTVPDVWEPLKQLTNSLLPHLRFHGIDVSNRDQVRCLFEVHSKSAVVDLDELSSGERSIVQMFYPLIEHRIKRLIQEIRQQDAPSARAQVCVLIDEPELHLHPTLQAKVIDYLRALTADENTQVIVATHSPSIVEYASFDELYLLRPVELVEPGENQLVQVASDEERLSFLRGAFGSTANLTAFLPVVIVEGGGQEERSRRTTDRKLYRALHQGFNQVTLVAGGGKQECIKLQTALQEALGQFCHGRV